MTTSLMCVPGPGTHGTVRSSPSRSEEPGGAPPVFRIVDVHAVLRIKQIAQHALAVETLLLLHHLATADVPRPLPGKGRGKVLPAGDRIPAPGTQLHESARGAEKNPR